MSSSAVHWQAPRLHGIDGSDYPARHCWCVGRNYAEHAREMGADPEREQPLFFSKPAQALTQQNWVDYPPDTEQLHHEVELVVLLGGGGRNLTAADWPELIYGYAVGVDLTRRDVQSRLKSAGHPWELSKGFDQSAPLGLVVPADQWTPNDESRIELFVNGQRRQHGRLGELIWPVAELLAQLSGQLTLNVGDLLFTGTPAGVGPVRPGDEVVARIEGLPDCQFKLRGPQ